MKKIKERQFRKGFTLLELIVVISIISIMTIVMLVTMFEDRENRELAAAARGVTAALREAQNNAISGLSRGEELPCRFVFRLVGDDIYQVKEWKRDADAGCPGNVEIIAEYSIGNDVEHLRGDPDNLEAVLFNVPHGDFWLQDKNMNWNHNPTSAGQIKLKKPGSSKTAYVCIYPSGQIVENGINNPC